ncbi:PREDICTED: G patch domain-containing protein 4 [Atta colombica]|uniref:G patch domain-containing protein 4 n=1 Tax=Atta colombica TaxID=520822 RepID=UPI00084C2318|nr:PREDICTED: G patch domain-containing protein 4 [Atta colombica]
MANFAKRELLKYGWEEGKGLGKNENGITEPVKLATNQNKAGIGYDENKPWWNSLYDDTIKNIKVESNGEEFSLMTIANAATSKTNRHNFWKKSVTLSPFYFDHEIFENCSDSEKTYAYMMNQKVGFFNKIMHEPMEYNFTSNGKLERIAQQDALYLNTNPLLSDAMINQKNDIVDKNAKSDIEENKCETINASILQCFEDTKDFVLSKTAKKKRKKKLHKLIQQLSTCSLEENNNQRQNYLDMKLKKIETPKMKKDKHMEERKNFKKIVSLYNSITSDNTTSSNTNEVKVTGGLFFQHTKLIQDKLFSKIKRKSIDQTSDILSDVKLLGSGRCEKGKDSTEHKVDQSLKVENVVDNKADESFKKDWIIIDVATKTDKERENFDCKANLLPKATDRIFKHDISKVEAKNKYNNPVEEINRDFYFLSLNKIQKKKNLRPPSKGIKKIAEKLKGEALANELNSAIKNLTIFSITDKLNANTVKKKLVVPTQTHRMPV